ncbi:DMT family transporter [Faunimonas sp. B44]|uniref:DMT family transporter n=1 Tax=Faunimonas sp. B44 TaxID=3461493 RepID=UPI004043B5C5
MSAPNTATDNRRGIAFMLAAMAAFLVNDTLVKLASADLPVGQIVFVRGLMATPLLLLAAWWQGVPVEMRGLFHPIVGLRTVGEMGSTGFYLSALAHLPIANATAILLLVPLATTAGAALFLREPVGLRRWTAIGIGLLGALIIVRPGMEGFTVWSVVALVAALFVTTRDLCSRMIPPNLPVFAVSAAASAAVAVVGLVMGLWEDWVVLGAGDYLYLAGSAVLLSAGYVLILHAMRAGDVAVVAPFRYSIILWAIAIQAVVFAAWPDLPTLAGSTILVATGLYTFNRERKRAKLRPAAAALTAPAPK